MSLIYIKKNIGIALLELNESGKISFIAIHAEDTFGNNNNLLISVMIFSNQSLQLGNIIVTIPDTFS